MYTNIKVSELPVNHGVYLEDLVNQIKDIEGCIFHSKGKPYCEIILLNEFPGPTMSGSHIAELATYATKIPTIYSPSVLMLYAKQECYIIWSTNVSKMLEYMLGRCAFSGVGDKAIKEAWFIIAIVLARFRALFRKDWFNGAQLRTRRSVVRHRKFLSESSDEIGSLLKLLDEFDSYARTLLSVQDAAMYVDIYWTLRLVIQSLEQGQSLDDALRFVIQD